MSPDEDKTNNKLRFSVDSQLLGELGERLVTKNYIALAELVKNAYDADATRLTIRLRKSKSGQASKDSEICLEDNGQGMTFQEVKNYWMRIATPIKKRNPISAEYGRRKTGSKGIGRFACRKLAMWLCIETVAKIEGSEPFEFTSVTFDWKDFKAGTLLTEVPCVYVTSRSRRGKTGTILRLQGLNEKWTNRDFNILRRQILSLSLAEAARRKGFTEDPGFELVFDAPEFKVEDALLTEEFMDAGWGRLIGEVGKAGKASLTLTAKEIGKSQYDIPPRFSELAGVKFDIAIVIAAKESIRKSSVLTLSLAKRIQENHGGVRVFLDGFRIYPYGDPNEDWLGIEKDIARRFGKVNEILEKLAGDYGLSTTEILQQHPRYRSLIGKVLIDSSAGARFEVKMDREGFLDNDAYRQLVQLIRLSLEWTTLHYGRFKLSVEKRQLRESERLLRQQLREIKGRKYELKRTKSEAINDAIGLISQESARAIKDLSGRDRKEVERRIEIASEFIKNSLTQTDAYSSMLGAVASSGVYLWVFNHEIKTLIGEIGTHVGTLDRVSKLVPPETKAELTEFRESLEGTRKRLIQQVDLFGMMKKATTDRERKAIEVRKEVDRISEGFAFLTDHYGVRIDTEDIPTDIRTGPMLAAEFYSIISNLVSNALKVVIAGNGRRVKITCEPDQGRAILRVFDDGVGISKEFQESVFEPLVADPEGRIYKGLRERVKDEELLALGLGTGIGLTIVKEIVRGYDGYVRFIDAKPPWKTCIEASLP